MREGDKCVCRWQRENLVCDVGTADGSGPCQYSMQIEILVERCGARFGKVSFGKEIGGFIDGDGVGE